MGKGVEEVCRLLASFESSNSRGGEKSQRPFLKFPCREGLSIYYSVKRESNLKSFSSN